MCVKDVIMSNVENVHIMTISVHIKMLMNEKYEFDILFEIWIMR